jgi:hypothetical protein
MQLYPDSVHIVPKYSMPFCSFLDSNGQSNDGDDAVEPSAPLQTQHRRQVKRQEGAHSDTINGMFSTSVYASYG